MAKTSMVRARIEPGLKSDVENLFHNVGLTTTEAITLFYRQVKLRNGLPFEVVIPNGTTVNIFKNTDANNRLVWRDDVCLTVNKLGI